MGPIKSGEGTQRKKTDLPKEEEFLCPDSSGLELHDLLPGSLVCQPALKILDLPAATAMGVNYAGSSRSNACLSVVGRVIIWM